MSTFYIFTAVVLLIFGLSNLYIYKRLIKKIALFRYIRKIFIAVLILLFVGQILFFSLRHTDILGVDIYFLLSLSFAPTYCLFFLTFGLDIWRLILKIARKKPQLHYAAKFGVECLIIILGGFMIYTSVANAIKVPDVKELDLSIKNLKQDMKIAMLSDVHLGKNLHEDFLLGLIEKINASKPDMVVIVGDLIDANVERVGYISKINELKSKYGTFYVPGNHEYYHEIYEILELLATKTNMHILLNKNIELDNFNIAGVGDLAGFGVGVFGPDIEKVKAELNTQKPSILLSHQPKAVKFFGDISDFDLILSGHTHGGQVFPFVFLVKLVNGFTSGLYKLSDATQMFISTGAGYWGPSMRVFAKSEIVILNLKGE